MFKLPDSISFEEGTFLLLAKEATSWVDSSGVKAGDRVVVFDFDKSTKSKIMVPRFAVVV